MFNTTLISQNEYRTLHSNAVVADLHIDVLYKMMGGIDISKRLTTGHVDLIRMREGGIDIQFFAAWPDPAKYKGGRMYEQSITMIELLHNLVEQNPDKIALTRTMDDIHKALREKKIAACLGIEGGTAIENSLEKLDYFYNLGVSYMTLTWNNSPEWATSARDETSRNFFAKKGLTKFGEQVIKRMNELGMMIDISHSGEKTVSDVLKISRKPVIASHSCVYTLCPHFRNLKDGQIKAIAKNGGVIFVNFYPGFLMPGFSSKYSKIRKEARDHLNQVEQTYAQDKIGFTKYKENYLRKKSELLVPGIKDVVNHIDYIVQLVGEDYVGLGSDFDGISVTPLGLEDISKMPEITKEMLKRGYSNSRIQKILGGNFLRVFEAIVN
jgi:membrane dipeptidase